MPVVETASVMAESHLWLVWSRIAIKNEAAAHDAMRRFLDPATPSNQNSDALGEEQEVAMVAISSACFALEALRADIATRAGPLPQPPKLADEERNAGDWCASALEVAADISGATAADWRIAMHDLFARRIVSVHFKSAMAGLVEHPGGGGKVSLENAMFCAPAAAVAVDVLLDALEALLTVPKPPIAEFAPHHGHSVNDLRGLRTLLGENGD